MRYDEEFLRHYFDELTYLRKMGQDFARQHPRIAGRLEMSGGVPADPHVERLVESFAFLTARIQRQLNGEFPEITTALLGVLYPHLVNPVPPMAIAQFEMDPKRGKTTTGYAVPARTPLAAHSANGMVCRFRTCYPVTLWPLRVSEAALEPASQYDCLSALPDAAGVLRLRLVPETGTFEDLSGLRELRFHLDGPAALVHSIYELLFTSVAGVALAGDGGGAPVLVGGDAVRPVGFLTEEEVIPCPRHAHPAFRLLQEYFHFPEKFQFFDLGRLEHRRASERLDVLLVLKRMPGRNLALEASNFRLGCTPVVNLFPRTSEPIRLDHRQLEYRLVADMRRERTVEIHSIASVSAASNPQEKTRRYEPFYSYRHSGGGRGASAFWHARRVFTGRDELPGTDVYLSFLDLDFRPAAPPDETVFAHLECTNRWLAPELPGGARLELEATGPIHRVTCLGKPTQPAYPPLGGASLWQLVSNLSLNHLSLGGEHGLEALQEILRVYSFSQQPAVFQQINGIRAVSSREVMRRTGREAWRGFQRGTEVTIEFDESQYTGSGAFLLAAVLRHFLALYASVNSFVELVARRTASEEEWKRWTPLAGEQPLL